MTEREQVLYNAGLYEKIYAPDTQKEASLEYPESEWNKTLGKRLFYRIEFANVSSEQFEWLLKNSSNINISDFKKNSNKNNASGYKEVQTINTSSGIAEKFGQDETSKSLWNSAIAIDAFGIIVCILTIIAGIIGVCITEMGIVFISAILLAIAVYFSCHVHSLTLRALATIAQNTKTSADVALYYLKK